MEEIKSAGDQFRFGIAEWYGLSFNNLTAGERRNFALLQQIKKKERHAQPCPPRLAESPNAKCTKDGGVCSIRLYKRTKQGVFIVPDDAGEITTTCPYRFKEGMRVFRWVGETILGHDAPIIVKEIGFLEKPRGSALESKGRKEVGRIDIVLIHPNLESLQWCALEMQAVYFSGDSMKKDFRAIAKFDKPGLPFPAGKRRPDYRSSGPKRLMPQLQIKVPTLRRWGRKMAVIVDRGFFNRIGQMDRVDDITNCDIAWFVLKYNEQGAQAVLEPDFVRFTTLERTVERLTGSIPVTLSKFEERIRSKLI